MPYSLPLSLVPDDLEYVAYLRADFDACPRNLSLNVGKQIARLIILIDSKGSFVSAPIVTYNNFFAKIAGANLVPIAIPRDCEVIELVLGVAGFLPYSEAEVAGGRRP